MRTIPYLNPENKEQISANWRKVDTVLSTVLPLAQDGTHAVRLRIDKDVAPSAIRLESKEKTENAWKVRQTWPLVAFKHITADYALTGNESGIIVDNAGGAIAITLPAVAASTASRYTVVQKSAGVTVTLTAAAGETVNGGATYDLVAAAYGAVDVFCDGVEWYAF